MPDRFGLPLVIAEIVQVAGVDAARALAAVKGGQQVYIPAEAKEGHWLTDLVGFSAAQRICEHYRTTNRDGRGVGKPLLIPMARIRSGEVLIRAIEAGGKNNRVAAISGRHERTVRRMRAKLKTGGLGPLFD
jgi:hypothetical protein